MIKANKYIDYLYEELEDPEFAEGYLNECLKDEDLGVFLLAIQDVAKAKGGMAFLAKHAKKNKESLYKTLSRKGNPYLGSMRDILYAMGFEFKVQQIEQPKKRKAALSTLKCNK